MRGSVKISGHMGRRRLGGTGLEVGPIAFGGTVLGWLVDESASFALLDAFVASGFNLIDTADSYYVWAPGMSGGESETIIGKWLKQRGGRDRIVLATKVGEKMGPGRGGLSKAHILRSAEESLQRLQTDYVDLYQAHVDDRDTPLDATLEAFDRLIRDGKARAIGCSNYDASRLAEALKVSREAELAPYRTLQALYNLYDRQDFEAGLDTLCLKHDLGMLAYRPLARGFLSGKYRSADDLRKHVRGEGVAQYAGERGFAILDALQEASAACGASMAQTALAWLLAKPAVTAAIAGVTKPAQIDELRQACEVRLDSELLRRLDSASRPQNS